jgi:hypothetical protein
MRLLNLIMLIKRAYYTEEENELIKAINNSNSIILNDLNLK